jgi:RNA recognition motif
MVCVCFVLFCAVHPTDQFMCKMLSVCMCVSKKNNRETETEWNLDLQEDVQEECEKHGRVVHMHVDTQDEAGCVYVRFESSAIAEKVAKAFHGRWFASRQIIAALVPISTYENKFPDAPKQ